MTGYYGPDATAEAFRGGWLTPETSPSRMSAVLLLPRPAQGNVKTGGENVYPPRSTGAVPAPAVLKRCGVPDRCWDEKVRAVVVPAAVCRRRRRTILPARAPAGHKIPKKIVFMGADQLPRSAAGKLVKSQLKSNLGWGA
jgi:fatty-acyl-CoA synthase